MLDIRHKGMRFLHFGFDGIIGVSHGTFYAVSWSFVGYSVFPPTEER